MVIKTFKLASGLHVVHNVTEQFRAFVSLRNYRDGDVGNADSD
jgi:hypothetical protein